jgi:hypothetical protein
MAAAANPSSDIVRRIVNLLELAAARPGDESEA